MTGIDLDKNEERSFYVESMVAVMEVGDQFGYGQTRATDLIELENIPMH